MSEGKAYSPAEQAAVLTAIRWAEEKGVRVKDCTRVVDRNAGENGHHRIFLLLEGEDGERHWFESTD